MNIYYVMMCEILVFLMKLITFILLTKPKFMCVITSNFSSVVKDSETGIYILPITALKP